MRTAFIILFLNLKTFAQQHSFAPLLNKSIIGIYDCYWIPKSQSDKGHLPSIRKRLSINADNSCRVTVDSDDGYEPYPSERIGLLRYTLSGTWAMKGDTIILVFFIKVNTDQVQIEKFICRTNELVPYSFEPEYINEQPITAPYTKMGWRCILIDENMVGVKTSAYYPNDIRSRTAVGNLYFIEDSVWSFEYPCQMLSVNKFYVGNDTIYITEPNQKWKCKLQNDTLSRINIRGSKEKYVPMYFDKNILQGIHLGIINPTCITGSWKLKTYQEVEYDNGFDIKYPIKLPDKITLTAKNIADSKNRIIQFSVEGVNRKFRIDKIIPHAGELILTPLGWWKGKPFSVYYHNGK